jgi:hypothetical protein
MDKSLYEILKRADFIFDEINNSIPSKKTLKSYIEELQLSIRTIQSVAMRMADISNTIQRNIDNREKTFGLSKPILKEIDPFPCHNDHVILRGKYVYDKCEIMQNLHVPAKKVQDISQIPISNLYYVENLQQFAISVNGMIITGNLGSFSEKTRVAHCKYGTKCRNILESHKCEYYHNAQDIAATMSKTQPEELKKALVQNVCNFSPGAWIYTPHLRKKTNECMRHIGGRDTILYDLEIIKNDKFAYNLEIRRRQAQIMHDYITLCILLSKGFVPEYADCWDS